jgi:hypothetical protein
MAAGIQPSLAIINQQIGGITLGLRGDFQAVLNFNNWLTSVGGATYLEGLGMSTADAQTVVSTYGNLAVLAGIWLGQGTQQNAFNYYANTEALWGGQ